jgi:hypothetical protein
MPNTRTNVCKTCGVEKTKAEFRDVGETRGRCPGTCRECREKDPVLMAHHLKNKEIREAARERQAAYARRSDEEVLAYQEYRYPDGKKDCPEKAGCGKRKSLEEFSTNRHQFDGLTSVCTPCFGTYGYDPADVL